jgi:DNA modification methylase
VPPGGTVLDPFVGSGTMMLAAMAYDCHGIGIDKMAKYIDIARARVDGAKLPLLEAA